MDRTWREVSGTSFSAPMVSAAASLAASGSSNLGNLQINRLLTNSASDLGDPAGTPNTVPVCSASKRAFGNRLGPGSPTSRTMTSAGLNGSLLG